MIIVIIWPLRLGITISPETGGGGAARRLGVGGAGVTLTQGGQSAWVELLKKKNWWGKMGH